MKHTLSGVLTTHITLFTTSKINNLSKLTQILRKGFIDIEPVRNVIRLSLEQMYYTRWWSQIHFVYPGIAYVEVLHTIVKVLEIAPYDIQQSCPYWLADIFTMVTHFPTNLLRRRQNEFVNNFLCTTLPDAAPLLLQHALSR